MSVTMDRVAIITEMARRHMNCNQLVEFLSCKAPRGWPRPLSSESWHHSHAGLWRALWWTWAARTA